MQDKKTLTIFPKTTKSTGPKRIVRPKEGEIAETVSQQASELEARMNKKRTLSRGANQLTKPKKLVMHTVHSVLQTFKENTEYGKTFRGLKSEEQEAEVEALNKGAVKGLKVLVKHTLLDTQYKKLIEDKMRQHLNDSRTPQASMVHCVPKFATAITSDPKFLSVGEWVEVDSDRTPGYNSEGGIALIIAVHDDLADVKYVFFFHVLTSHDVDPKVYSS
jgi:hypothetical protein